MLIYKVMVGLCLLMLLAISRTLAAAQKKGDRRQIRILHLLRIGISFSAISYLLRILLPNQAGHSSPLSFFSCLLGTAFIWLGWMGHWKRRGERLRSPHDTPIHEENVEINALKEPMAGNTTLPRLTPRVHQVLDYAQDEAQRRGHSGVDTEHLLLGLLREPCSTGVSILERLPVSAKKIHQELLTQMGPCRNRPGHRPTTWLPLTERAHQVLALASHEAHRFDTRYVATEHLLLGLLLAGKGKAASVLFGEGVTVAGIHAEIIKSKNAPSHVPS